MTSTDSKDEDRGEAELAAGRAVDLDLSKLAEFFKGPLPASEAAMWAAMSVDRRAKAMQRMKALAKWDDGNGPLSPPKAAEDAGLSLNRFFEMAKAWRDGPTLAALGTFAKSSRRLDPREKELRKMVSGVLGPWPTGSVRQGAIALGEAYEASRGIKVGLSMLRRVVEDELRRRDLKAQLGNDVQFDCSACSVLRRDGEPYALFAILDRGSQLLLGAALGDVRNSRGGYAEASRDALRRIRSVSFADLPWIKRLARMEIVAGLDAERWVDARQEMAAVGVKAPVEPSVRAKRFGRYLRNAVGGRLGLIDLWYGRTVPDHAHGFKTADRSPRLAPDDAQAFLAAQVDAHNADRRVTLPSRIGARPPRDLMTALTHLAAS